MTERALDRRSFLALTGAAAASVAVASEGGWLEAAAAGALSLDAAPFTLGVASGYPDDTSVVLWTRWAPDPLSGVIPSQDVTVGWQVAADEQFTDIVDSGSVTAEPAWAHAVHVTVVDLVPDRWYWYRFEVGGVYSRVGRTRTLPPPTSLPDRLRFAIASCQHVGPTGGVHPAYRDMAEHDLDLVFHLGDYIYEDGTRSDLATYRALHTRYKTVTELRDAHARFPFITVWDDHEILNNWSREDNLVERRTNGFKAYYEHLPMRTPPDGQNWPVYHHLSWGELASFFVLDTRQYRNKQACGPQLWVPRCSAVDDPQRTITGVDQESWLINGLNASPAAWNVIAQQTVMAQFDYDVGSGVSINTDQWDGYTVNRQAILQAIASHRPRNPVVLSGDWHSHWVNDIMADFDDPDSEVLATEFVGTSISSNCGWDPSVKNAWHVNPHVKFFDGAYRGYTYFDVTQQRMQAFLRVVEDARDPASPAHTIAEYEVVDGQPGARIPGGVYAVTGRKIPGPQSEGLFSDLVLGNELMAMTVAVDFEDPQLPGATRGKPIDLAATGYLDRLDWLSLPYVAAGTRPSGGGAWSRGLVSSSSVDVVSGGPDVAVVQTVGQAQEAPVSVTTTFSIESNQPWVTAESRFTNTGSQPLTVWIGDVIDHDGAGEISGVAGHGTVSGATVNEYQPAGPWIGMTGDDPQSYGVLYKDADFVAYGSGLWMQSQRQVTLAPGVAWTLRRRVTAVGTRGHTDPWSTLDFLSRPRVFAGTGYRLPGPLSAGGPNDITIGNHLVAMTVAVELDHNQLPGFTMGKPVDILAAGHLDQIDWINLPYVATSRPTGGGAWDAGKVESDAVEVQSPGPDTATVHTEGAARDVPVTVMTTYHVEADQPWITAESAFVSSADQPVTVWIGDVIDHDGAGQVSGVAGHGTITGATVAEYSPSGPWIAMTGNDPQTYGLIYDDTDFVAYGSGLWMQSQRQVTLTPGVAWTLRRRIVAIDTTGRRTPWSALDGL